MMIGKKARVTPVYKNEGEVNDENNQISRRLRIYFNQPVCIFEDIRHKPAYTGLSSAFAYFAVSYLCRLISY